MQKGIAAALAVSVILIGGATSARFASHKKTEPTLSAVSNPIESKDNLISAYLKNSTSTRAEAENLTGTDLVGRQLILDYIALARAGEATPNNLSALAERYTESIPTLLVPTTVSYFDLKIVSNSQVNLGNYSKALDKIYRNYASEILRVDSQDPQFELMADTYSSAAIELKSLSAPSALADSHLILVNIYLENTTAANALSNYQNDPARSFAGLIVIRNNAEKEQETLGKIKAILDENGI